jgi:hypothetical protein
MFKTKPFSGSIALIALTLALLVSPSLVQAQSQPVCFCHNYINNPVTICTDDDGLINGHMAHVESGIDLLGECPAPTPTPTPGPTPPPVPEFGLVTGLIALAGSTGAFGLFRKRSQ